jgi:cobalamin-dependent methionine synthase I
MGPLQNFSPQLTIIGERLNASRDEFRSRLTDRDSEFVVNEARRQQQAGASHLDVNAGAGPKHTDDTLWLLATIVPALGDNTGLLLSSDSADCVSRALEQLKGRAHTIVNPVTDDTKLIAAIAPLAAAHKAGLVAAIDHAQPLPSAEKRHAEFSALGIPDERLYFDAQVLPLAHQTSAPQALLQSLPALRQRFPRAHLLAGVSNVSFNVPRRSLLNRTFAAMLIAAGADALLCDPCDKRLRETLVAARALAGKDDFLTDYLASM